MASWLQKPYQKHFKWDFSLQHKCNFTSRSNHSQAARCLSMPLHFILHYFLWDSSTNSQKSSSSESFQTNSSISTTFIISYVILILAVLVLNFLYSYFTCTHGFQSNSTQLYSYSWASTQILIQVLPRVLILHGTCNIRVKSIIPSRQAA